MTNAQPVSVDYHYNAMEYTPTEAFYDFIWFDEQGKYLFEYAMLQQSTHSKIDEGLRQCLYTRWVFHTPEAETFYVLKWTRS